MANGMYTNAELIDSMIVELNKLPKLLIDNQFIALCDLIAKMGQKLGILKKGIQDDLANKDQRIDELKQLLKDYGCKVEDMTPEEFAKKYEKKDGDNNGGC